MNNITLAQLSRKIGMTLCILFLVPGILIRSMVPVGYMPDSEALSQGQIFIHICNADGQLLLMPLDNISNNSKNDPDRMGHENCPCCLIHDELISIYSSVALVAKDIKWSSYPFLSYTDTNLLSAYGVRGPPLGSRAPPTL